MKNVCKLVIFMLAFALAMSTVESTTHSSAGVSSSASPLPFEDNSEFINLTLWAGASTTLANNVSSARTFGVIGSTTEKPSISNFYWLFGNQSISYNAVLPSQIVTATDLSAFSGLIVWTKQGGYNASAIKQFAQTHVVIADIRDFCGRLYTSLSSSMRIVNNNTVIYDKDWGNFHTGDLVDIKNETGNNNQLTGVLATSLGNFGNMITIAQFDNTRVASFFMNGTQTNSGFFVMDLDATTPESDWTGIWHVFPAVKMVQDFPTGTYAEWMANGQEWWNLTWVYNRIDTIVSQNRDIAKKIVIGYSVDNRSIPAIIIGNGTNNAIIDGSIHGNEKTGTFACLRIAELLIQYYRSDPYWKTSLTRYKVIIVPTMNPDGFADDTRGNAHGVDLNRQFPPLGTTTEPEAWALRNLMGNYTPTIYVNIHEGWYWDPFYMIYGYYLSGSNRTITINALQQANQTFVGLHHYGWFTDGGSHIWVGKVDIIGYGGSYAGMASDYASYAYNASSTILETFVWSGTYGARQCLWALDYYPAVTIAFLKQRIPQVFTFQDGFESGSFNGWTGTYVTPGETASVAGAPVYQGNYCARFASNGTGGYESAYSYESVPDSSNLYASGHFYVSQSGIAQNDDRFYFIEFSSGTSGAAYAGWRRSGGVDRWELVVRDATGWAIVDSNSSLSLNKWYSLELYWAEGATDGHAQLYVDRELVCSIQNQNTTGIGEVDQVSFGLAAVYYCGPATIYADFCRIQGSPPWDLNHDGKVDLKDVIIVARLFGYTRGSPNWNPIADLNADGIVDGNDLITLARHFGEQYA